MIMLISQINGVHSLHLSLHLQAQVSKADFTTILHKIGNCEVFQSGPYRPQAPVEWQLLVTLANLGLSGNGGSCPIKAKLFSLAGEFKSS